MKKLLMSLVLLPLMALADAEKVGDVTWSYRVSSEKVTVKGANPCAGKLEIPQTLGGYPVSGISPAAFSGCEDLTEMVIPEGVAEIGAAAFCDCIGLTSVTIPSGVTSIGECVFSCCYGLMSISVNEGNASYCSVDGVLYDKAKTELFCHPPRKTGDMTIPESVTIIRRAAFGDCSGLTSVTIPDGVTSIGEFAFEGCIGLTSVTIPSTVTNIGPCVFGECSGVTSVTISEGVTSVGSGMFQNCSGLMSVTIPSSVTSIESGAFLWCSGLTSMTIPEGVTSIGLWAFQGCDSLETIHVSAGDTERVKAMITDSDSGIDVDLLTFVEPLGDGGPYTETVDGIEWTFGVKDGKASVGYSFQSGAISKEIAGAIAIPSTLGDCPVTSGSRRFPFASG